MPFYVILSHYTFHIRMITLKIENYPITTVLLPLGYHTHIPLSPTSPKY